MNKDKPIPLYLRNKLFFWGIKDRCDLLKYNYIEVYKWIKDIYPSASLQVLYDLFCINHNIEMHSLTLKVKNDILSCYKNFQPVYAPLSLQTITANLNHAQEKAQENMNNEIPIGAIIVYNNKIIAHAKNLSINDNIANHCEIIAINEASKVLNTTRLTLCDLYVTIEPCLMCSGAIINSRIKRLIFGAIQPKTGAVISQYNVFRNLQVNKHTQVIGPVSNLYAQQIQTYFSDKR